MVQPFGGTRVSVNGDAEAGAQPWLSFVLHLLQGMYLWIVADGVAVLQPGVKAATQAGLRASTGVVGACSRGRRFVS